MEKLLYLVSILLCGTGAWVGYFNIELIRTTPDVTLATAANLMIFPGNLFLQALVFFSLALIFRKLNSILHRSRYSEFLAEGHNERPF